MDKIIIFTVGFIKFTEKNTINLLQFKIVCHIKIEFYLLSHSDVSR
jgi:hypothetical protein